MPTDKLRKRNMMPLLEEISVQFFTANTAMFTLDRHGEHYRYLAAEMAHLLIRNTMY